jgi:ribose 5-phosphate isomerase A
MDLKKEAARVAYSLIENKSSIGLGDGSAVRYLASYIIDGMRMGLELTLYTSSYKTEEYLRESGITANDISTIDQLNQYFDGCDQIDGQLNALKSGSGIHTQEKLLAAMSNNFFILADESKFISEFGTEFPLVLEVLPQAVRFVARQMKSKCPGLTCSIRKSPDNPGSLLTTRNGNHLIDCHFPRWPDPEFIQNQARAIVGVVEISLFYNLANYAIIGGKNEVCQYGKKYGVVSLISRHSLEKS